MRRILATVLAVVMVMSALTALTLTASADATSVITLDKTTFAIGEDISGTITDCSATDWVAIGYQANAGDGQYMTGNYAYPADNDGAFTIKAPTEPGTYYVTLFEDDGYACSTYKEIKVELGDVTQAYKGVAWVTFMTPGAYNEDSRFGTYFVTAADESYLQWCSWMAGFCIKWDDEVSHWVVTGAQGESYGYGNALSGIIGSGLDDTVPYAEMVVAMGSRSADNTFNYVQNRGFSLWGYCNQPTAAWIGQYAYIYNVDFLTGTTKYDGAMESSDYAPKSYVTVGGDKTNVNAEYTSEDDVLVASPADVMAMNDRSAAWIQVEFGRTNTIEYGSKPSSWCDGVSSIDICWKNAVPNNSCGVTADMFAVMTDGHAVGDVINLDVTDCVTDGGEVYYVDTCGAATRWDGSLCEGDGPYADPLPVGEYDVVLIADNGDEATGTIIALEPLTVTAPSIKNIVAAAKYTEATLSWTAFEGASKYTVQVFDEEANEVFMKNVFGTAVKVTGLAANSNYTMTIKAMNGKTQLSAKSAVNFSTKAYSNVAATAEAGKTSVKLTWAAVEGAAEYRIAQKIDGEWVAIKDASGTATYIKGLTAGTAYDFSVMAIAANKSRMGSSYDDAAVAVTTVADATIDVTVVRKNDTRVVASWADVDGATKYQIFVNGTLVKVTPLTASWVTGLNANDVITVKAIDAIGSALCTSEGYTF